MVYQTSVETWKAFEANELTHSAAHHLLAIDEVGAAYGGWARVSDIARALNITRGSVSINLRALRKRGWVQTNEHRLVRLTPRGVNVVHAIRAKRAIVTTFLRDVLGVPDELAEIDGCKVEHLISDDTAQRLAQFLRVLHSGSPASRQLLAQFRRAKPTCPPNQGCDLCTDRCLIDGLRHAR